ncbi:hypothetical protein FOXB_02520, partial [Fusarium oxysporum f. sp. conglutinans Fo5176]
YLIEKIDKLNTKLISECDRQDIIY